MSTVRGLYQKHADLQDSAKNSVPKLMPAERSRQRQIGLSRAGGENDAGTGSSGTRDLSSKIGPSKLNRPNRGGAIDEEKGETAGIRPGRRKSKELGTRPAIVPQFSIHDAAKQDFDGSFTAEDNENELSSLAIENKRHHEHRNSRSGAMNPENSVQQPHGSVKGASKQIQGVTKIGKKQVPEHFEQEMHKHGLLDKIVHIQQLNNFFEVELGGNKKIGDNSRSIAAEVQNSPNTTVDKGYAFPFQKRARSNSPPKNGVLFGPKSNDELPSDIKVTRKPVMARTNFVIGKSVMKPKKAMDQFAKIMENEEAIDRGGLSTGPTDEIQKMHSTIEEDDSEWMYQRIIYANAEKEAENTGDVEEGGSFLQLLKTAQFDK